MLVLKDLPWWLEHPEELALLLTKALEYESEEPAYRGPVHWFGHNRADWLPGTARGGTERGTLAVPDLERYAKHPEQMRPALEIEIATTRQRARANQARSRDDEDRGMELLTLLPLIGPQWWLDHLRALPQALHEADTFEAQRPRWRPARVARRRRTRAQPRRTLAHTHDRAVGIMPRPAPLGHRRRGDSTEAAEHISWPARGDAHERP